MLKERETEEEWIIQLERRLNSQGKADTISSSDSGGDNYCRGTESRFQCGPEKNRAPQYHTARNTIITRQPLSRKQKKKEKCKPELP